jgi:hypothetical protein
MYPFVSPGLHGDVAYFCQLDTSRRGATFASCPIKARSDFQRMSQANIVEADTDHCFPCHALSPAMLPVAYPGGCPH